MDQPWHGAKKRRLRKERDGEKRGKWSEAEREGEGEGEEEWWSHSQSRQDPRNIDVMAIVATLRTRNCWFNICVAANLTESSELPVDNASASTRTRMMGDADL